jgi:pimeloyl-[acyl-carrier protein] methyl ester esterase
MHFVFVHGWGFNPEIWRDVIRNTGNAEVTLVDLGFIAGGPRAATEWPGDAVAVGHSLGLLWLLHRAAEEGRAPFRALVSVQGFDRFCPPIPPSRGALNVGRLDEGLGWLMDWDETETKAALACPTLALAARDDAVVPQAMSEAIWRSDAIRWSSTGGHVLPLKHPEWCANHVLDFAHALKP